MNYNTHTFDNGLRIIHRPSQGDVIYCGYAIKAGTRDELPGEEGLAHFCEHASFKGTERRRSSQVIKALEGVGGELNAFTNKQSTVYYAATQRKHLNRAIDLLSDMVFHSTYPQAELEKEKEVVCDEIESYNDSPAELIYDEFENIIFRGHPLGHNILGTAERVRSFTSDDARRFTQKHYRPDNAIFFIYGDVDFKKVVRELGKATTSPNPSQGGELLSCSANIVTDSNTNNVTPPWEGEVVGELFSCPANRVTDSNTNNLTPPWEGAGEVVGELFSCPANIVTDSNTNNVTPPWEGAGEVVGKLLSCPANIVTDSNTNNVTPPWEGMGEVVGELSSGPANIVTDSNTNNVTPPWEGMGEVVGEVIGEALIRNLNTHQAHVMIGRKAYDINHPRRLALYLLNNILGGPAMSSRLNMALRERNGLVYTVESTMVSYADTGLWSIYFGCDPHDVKRCQQLVRHELDKLMAKPLTERQLQQAKTQLTGQIALACDSRESFALDFARSFLHYGWEKDVSALCRNIEALTADDILQTAREMFQQDKMTTLIYK